MGVPPKVSNEIPIVLFETKIRVLYIYRLRKYENVDGLGQDMTNCAPRYDKIHPQFDIKNNHPEPESSSGWLGCTLRRF
jgi:hypothetical protein